MTFETVFLSAQLAGMSYNGQGPPAFSVTNSYATELSKNYTFKELKIQEEGFHRKCALITLLVLASISTAAGVWLLAYQGMAAWTSSGILFGLSLSMIIWIALTVHCTLKAEKKLRASFDHALNKTIALPQAVQDMGKMTREENRLVLQQFTRQQFGTLMDHVLTQDGAFFSCSVPLLDALAQDQTALLVEKIEEKEERKRDFALALLRHIDMRSCSLNLRVNLLAMIGIPQNEEEASLLAQDHAALESHLSSFTDKKEKKRVQSAFLHLLKPEPPVEAIQLMIFAPDSVEEAELLAGHFPTLQVILRKPNREFSIAMLSLLASDSYPELLDLLILNLGGKSYTDAGQTALLRHPQRIQYLVNAGKIPDPKYDFDRLVEHPQELIEKAQGWFSPETIASIFLKMSTDNKTIFLQKIAQSYEENPEENVFKRLASVTIEALLHTDSFMTANDLAPLAATRDYQNLLAQIGRWPEIVGHILYVTDFGTAKSLLKHHRFIFLFFNNISRKSKEVMFTTAAEALSTNPKLADTYTSWICDYKSYSWFYQKPLMASTPHQMADVACRLDTKAQGKVEEVVALMTREQKLVYKEQCCLYFPTFYERQLYKFEHESFNVSFKASLEFLIAHPEWVKAHGDLAKKYCELLVVTNLFPDLRETLQKEYPSFFDFFEVSLDGETVKVPAARLMTLGPVFEKYVHGQMKETTEKRVSLFCEEEIDQPTKTAFLQFLAFGTKPDFNQIDTIGLTFLSQKNELFELLDLCNLKLIDNLDDLNDLVNLVQYAHDYALCDLRFFCWEYIQGLYSNDYALFMEILQKSLDQTNSKEQSILDVVRMARQSAKNGCQFKYYRGKKCVKYRENQPYFSFSPGSCKLLLYNEADRPPKFIHALLNYLPITAIEGRELELANLKDSEQEGHKLFSDKIEFIPTDTD